VGSLQKYYARFYCRKTYRNYQNETLNRLENDSISPNFDNGFEGTFANQAFQSLHEGSLGIKLKVPLKGVFAKNERGYRLTAKNKRF